VGIFILLKRDSEIFKNEEGKQSSLLSLGNASKNCITPCEEEWAFFLHFFLFFEKLQCSS